MLGTIPAHCPMTMKFMPVEFSATPRLAKSSAKFLRVDPSVSGHARRRYQIHHAINAL